MMADDLKCPYCGKQLYIAIDTRAGLYWWRCYARGCYADGPQSRTVEDAIDTLRRTTVVKKGD